MRLRPNTLLSLGLLWCSAIAQAKRTDQRWTHFGLRPLGMGNAFVAVADDYNSLFYNPAGLARLKTWDGELLNPKIEISQQTVSSVNKMSTLASGASDSSQILQLISDESGNHHHASFGLTPHLIFPNFGFGIGLDFVADLVLHRNPGIYVNLGPRVVAPIAFAWNALENRLSFGVGVKLRVKGGIDSEFSVQDFEAVKAKNGQKDNLSKYVEGGMGIGGDFGVLFTPVKTMEPTFGLSVTDLGGTPYIKKFDVLESSTRAPELQNTSVNMGMSIKPIKTDRTYLLASLDMHSMNLPYSFSKKVQFGAEWGLGEILKIQTGFHQGYLSGGFQFDVGLLSLRAVTYSTELGTVAGENQDRRYALQLKLLI